MNDAPRFPFRAYAFKDGEEPSWWTSVDKRLFTRTSGIRETVLINELTWIADGRADQSLRDLFEKKSLYSTHRPH